MSQTLEEPVEAVGEETPVPERGATPLWAAAAVLFLLVFIAYIPAMNAGFIWDDDDYVTENMTLRSVEGLGQIWFQPGAVPQYYPLVHSTFWLEYRLWELNPRGYHIVNLLLHALSSLLLWVILCRLKVPGALFIAAVFAVHPVHVESVAWITERKNVLSLFFYLSSALLYLRFLGIGGESQKGRPGLYAAALVLFLCALLSKTVTASLPAALMLVIYWQRGRIVLRDVTALLPFFALGIGFGLFTAYMGRTRVGAVGPEWDLTIVERTLIAGRAAWFYAASIVAPYRLAFIYPKWAIDAQAAWQYLFPIAAAALVATLWFLRHRIGRGPLVAVLFFGGTLFPALGYFNVYPMKFSWVADHFQYHASIGLIVLLGATGTLAMRRLQNPAASATAGAVLICVLLILTFRQGHIYKDYETVWRDTLAKNPTSPIALNSVASVLVAEGNVDGAIELYLRALETDPKEDVSNFNLGKILVERGHLEDGAGFLAQSIETSPECAHCHYYFAVAMAQMERLDEAIQHYEQSLALEPGDPYVHYNYGVTLLQVGAHEDAIEHFSEATRINPELLAGFIGMGDALMEMGDIDAARQVFEETRRKAPGWRDVEMRLRALREMEDGAAEPARSP